MSRTDKDRPYWVQVRDPLFPYGLRAFHRHHGRLWQERGCDIDFPMPIPRGRRDHANCEWWPKYKDYEKIFGRSGWRRRHPGRERRARATLRLMRREWMTLVDRSDIDSYANAPSQRWVWAGWYWD